MRISMIPFGLLSGFMDSKEIRITELGEDGFRFRLAEECPEPEQFLIYFYDMKKAGYRRVEIRKFGMSAAEDQCLQDQQPVEKKTGKYFYREYSVRVEQKDYVQEVRRLAGEYNRYIRLKLDGDDGELAKSLTGYPAELDEMHCRSLEEQKKRWFFRENEKASGNPQDTMGAEELRLLDNAEFALELNCTSLYEEYLCQPLQAFLASYWQKNYLTHSYFAGRIPDRFYIGNQFCHNLFPTEEQLFSIMDKMYLEGSEITLVFSYIREFMLLSVGKLLEKVDNWCCIHGVNVEIVVNDWAMVEMLCGKTSRLHPVLGALLNKRKKDPRMKYKSGDTLLFQQNSLNAGFYRDFLAEEFISTDTSGSPVDIHRSFPREKTVCICLFIRQTLRSIVHCMLCAPLGIVVHSSLRSTVRNFVKNSHFFIRNIYTWQGGIIPCSVWIKHFRRYLKCGKI